MNGAFSGHAAFLRTPDPDNPGWHLYRLRETGCFNEVLGTLLVRPEGEMTARVRMMPERAHCNYTGAVHGGALMTFADMAMFAGAMTFDVARDGWTTIDFSMQFIASARGGKPLDLVVEILGETGRMVFTRGIFEQDGALVASVAITFRKFSGPKTLKP